MRRTQKINDTLIAHTNTRAFVTTLVASSWASCWENIFRVGDEDVLCTERSFSSHWRSLWVDSVRNFNVENENSEFSSNGRERKDFSWWGNFFLGEKLYSFSWFMKCGLECRFFRAFRLSKEEVNDDFSYNYCIIIVSDVKKELNDSRPSDHVIDSYSLLSYAFVFSLLVYWVQKKRHGKWKT